MHEGDALPLVSPDQAMAETLLVMSEKSFGIAGVVEAGCLIGVISDGDLRRNMADLMEKRAGDVATKTPHTIRAEMLAAEALAEMSENKITALFVVDGQGVPVGLLHLHDCLRAGIV